jgi:hypothetical protein
VGRLQVVGRGRFRNRKKVVTVVTNSDGVATFRAARLGKPGTFTLKATAELGGSQLVVSVRIKVTQPRP